MKRILDWWNTTCEFCLQFRRIVLDAAQLALSLLIILGVIFSSLFGYWIFWDTNPAIYYGPNGSKEFVDDHIIFDIDATRLRACETTIRRKITGGCGQITLQETFATTPVGQKAPAVSIHMNTILSSLPREKLSGSVCFLVNHAESYCNPAQRLLKMPIITESPPIGFIPVPRMKSYAEQTLP